MNKTIQSGEEELRKYYFHGIQKRCENCLFYRSSWWSNRCLQRPKWTLHGTIETCKFDWWVPDQKVYNKVFKEKGNA